MSLTQKLLQVLKEDGVLTYTDLKLYSDRWGNKPSTAERRLREARNANHGHYNKHVGVEMKNGSIISYKWINTK